MSYEKQYFDPSNEAGYAGAHHLIRLNAKGKKSKKEKERILEWLRVQDAYTLHRPLRKKFPRLHYNVTNVDDLWEADLCQMTTLKNENDNYNYLLVMVDALSKYAWVEPLKNKSASTVAEAFEKILKRANNRVPVALRTDRGKEFIGSALQNILKKHNIQFRVARNPDIKAAIVERLNRTLKQRLWRYFTHHNTHRYIDVIQKIVDAYNNTLHSGTKMRPVEVNLFNAARARANLERRAIRQNKQGVVNTAKYKPGDYVRVSRAKGVFAKGYEYNFSEEILRVKRVLQKQGIYIYELEDLKKELIDGFFYAEELTLVSPRRLDDEQTFKIERIIQTKGRGKNKQVLVKWLGYGNEFNSWIKASEVQNIE